MFPTVDEFRPQKRPKLAGEPILQRADLAK
jgi:hypothetical protein